MVAADVADPDGRAWRRRVPVRGGRSAPSGAARRPAGAWRTIRRCTRGRPSPRCRARRRSDEVGVGLGAALVVAHVLDPGRGLVGLDPERAGPRGRAAASSAGRRRGGGCGAARPSASRNVGDVLLVDRYSTLISIGPLRGLMSSATCGSCPAVERVEVELGPRRQRQAQPDRARPRASPRRPRAAPSAGPGASATLPQSQLPSAMPPKAAVW